MSGKDRGMMKWAPYKSLIEQEDALTKAKILKQKKEKPTLTVDAQEEINEILVNYHNQEVTITYWKDGYVYNEKGIISKIDASLHNLRINYKLITFDSLISISEN